MVTRSVLFVACLTGSLSADSVVLRPVADSTIYFTPGFETSNSKGEHLFTGNTAGGQTRRGLMKFDIAGSLPPDAVISDVELTLVVTRLGPSAASVSIHRCVSSWAEGTSDAADTESAGAPASPGDPSWTFASYDTRPWNAVGGDFNSVPHATTPSAGSTSLSFNGPNLNEDVASWHSSPAENFGWLIRGEESSFGTSIRFGTRENAIETDRPSLYISYTRTCAADFNWDATVDFFDYLDFVQVFSESETAADFNNDQIVDFFDYLDFVAAFSEGC